MPRMHERRAVGRVPVAMPGAATGVPEDLTARAANVAGALGAPREAAASAEGPVASACAPRDLA